MHRCKRPACAIIGSIGCTNLTGPGRRLDCSDIVTLHKGREES